MQLLVASEIVADERFVLAQSCIEQLGNLGDHLLLNTEHNVQEGAAHNPPAHKVTIKM